MLTCVIPYVGNQHGLSQLLVSLQPQLHPDDDIYVVDMSKDLSGLRLAGLYGSTRCYIFVEKAFGIDADDAIRRGFENMKENKQDGILAISDRCVISSTFVANIKKALKVCNHYRFVPNCLEVVPGSDRMNANFSWYGGSQTKIVNSGKLDAPYWNASFCEVIRSTIGDNLDNRFDSYPLLVANETVMVLPA